MGLSNQAFFGLFLLVLLFQDPATAFPLFDTKKSSASAYCTNYDLTYKLSPIPAPVRNGSSSIGAKTWKLSIDDTSSGYKQTVQGFGAAVTDATVVSFNSLSRSKLDSLLKDLLSSKGAGFSVMRHTIGASDLSATAYSYDDNGGKPDTNLTHFALGPNGTNMANLIKKMKAKNPDLQLVGSPWSPPGWMKRNGVLLGNTTENNLKDQYLDSNETNYAGQWAQYFVKYIQAFAKLGVTVDSITPQNEPLYSSAGYPTMYMFDYEQGHLIQDYLGPALSTAGLSTNIWAYDHNTDHAEYPQNVLNIASQHTSAVAWHCYASNIDWSVLTSFHNSNPSVQQYMTECWTPQTDATNWYQAANFTLGPLQNYAAGIIAWTLGTDSSYGPYLPGGCDKCKGLVTILPDGSYTFNLSSYLMAQFSKFMPRGSTVLAGSGSAADHNAPGIRSVATLNPDRSISVVILNTFDNDVVVTLTTQSGQTWSGNVIAKSVVTWVLPASQRLSGIVIPGLGDLPFPVPDYLPIR